MLDSLVRNSFVRYAALAGTLLVSNPTYAQTASGSSEGAYYIDPAKRRELQEKKERERAAEAPAPPPAQLSPPPPATLEVACNTAEECFQAGTRLYQEKNFERAAEFFKRSYTLAPQQRSRSILLYNTALAHEKAGDAVASMSYYELYLRELPNAGEKEDIQRKMPGLRLYAEADRLQEAGKHREAAKLYREAHALTSDADTLAAITKDRERSEQQWGEKVERPSASAAPSYLQPSSPSSPQEREFPHYLQPQSSPPPTTEASGGKGWAWAMVAAGVLTTAIGTQMDWTVCERGTIPRTGEYVDDCRTNKDLKYITMGGGILITGIGVLWLLQ